MLTAETSDSNRLKMMDVVRTNNVEDLYLNSWASSRSYRFYPRDRALLRERFSNNIFTFASRRAGSILTTYVDSRFATETAIDGQSDLFCFAAPAQGDMTLIVRGEPTTGTAARGLAYRLSSDMTMITSDKSVRTNVFVQAAKVEEALENMLDKRLSKPIEFRPSLDWSWGLTASLKVQLDFIQREFERSDGVANNAVALASVTDLLMTLILRGVSHNYTDQLELERESAVPLYVRRAEEFMRVHCADPIRVSDIAAAAGCSVRTLGSTFQRFRGRTPLAALHACRLDQLHAELSRSTADTPIGAVARRYGFTNASRLKAAFQRRFGEAPSDIVRRSSR
ncbi:helix-turn-helix transcriptional regulator [Neoroseomonas rubea]|uniref:helix-turn-helix transcriptional regulator n=1 Tax=Neoroseomonas rubea TaxID=2748666 RepID=UPI0018E05772|nr:helix-turn-helix transcriptional regulator [Roseomonas rubea]